MVLTKRCGCAIVADGAAHRIDAAGQCRFRHDAPVPYGGDDIVAADHPVAVADEKGKQVEHLRFEFDRRTGLFKFPSVEVELAILEGVTHAADPFPVQNRAHLKGIPK